MNTERSPSLATWMLEHIVPRNISESLKGDLLEEFRFGRSSLWYWRQTLNIVALSWYQAILDRRIAFLFASVWSMLAPTWMILTHTKNLDHLISIAQQLDWPWSSICSVVLQISPQFAFIWMGLLLTLVWNATLTKQGGLQTFRQGFVRGTMTFMPIWLASSVLKGLLSSSFGLTMIFNCFPFFVATLYAIWDLCNLGPIGGSTLAKNQMS